MKEGGIIELNGENFDKHISKGNWVIDFWAEWCGPCKIMAPHFLEASKEFKGKVNFGKVDVDAENELAGRFQVMSIPTTIFFKDREQVNRAVGAMPKDAIVGQIKNSF